MTAEDDARDEALARWAGARLRSAPQPTDGVTALLARIAREPLPAADRSGWRRWFSVPVLVTACIALAAGIGLGLAWPASRAAVGTADATPGGAARPVRFVFVAPSARAVALVGEFNGWNPDATPMRRDGHSNVWLTSVALAPGRHEYAFVVDDSTWVADPQAPVAPEDWFGARNSVLVVANR